MSPPPLSSAKRLKSWAPATQYSSKSLPKEAAKAQRRLSSQTPDHTHISISKSVLNIYQLCIEGQTLDIPSDPFESFRFIRDQTLVSYRAVVCGNSTARDQTLTFGVVVAGPGPAPGVGDRGSSLPKPSYLDADIITGDAMKRRTTKSLLGSSRSQTPPARSVDLGASLGSFLNLSHTFNLPFTLPSWTHHTQAWHINVKMGLWAIF